jgi:hypothetical protein
MAPAMRRPFSLDNCVGGLGDDPRSKPHRSGGGRAAAGLHAVGVAGDQPDLLGLDPQPFADDLRKARLVALTRRHRPQHELDDAGRVDRDLSPLARRAGVEFY